eukprot:TRINITY_DN9992_c0_g1_i1.p1 TRINITY_DN9992_c0_g1~~TRINITY_DN9992_c0_g1_i1.p1  ORF type:complete len:126 (+),score=19.10 TRINITY_DN9992_c0_g1_i1:186-563(+)
MNNRKYLFENHSFYLFVDKEKQQPPRSDLEQLILCGKGKLLKSPPTPPTSMIDLVNSKSITHVITYPDCCPEKSKQLFLETSYHPISYLWLFDSLSMYELQPERTYQINLCDPNLYIETQNSISF